MLIRMLLGIWLLASTASNAEEQISIKVMTFNIWKGGEAGKQPLKQTAEVIRKAQADVVGLQEVAGKKPKGLSAPDNGEKIAEMLNWNYVRQGKSRGVATRFKIVAVTGKKHGVKLEMPNGQQFYLFNVHLAHAPYQPYQLMKIPYNGGKFLETEEEAIEAANQTHGKEIAEVLKEIKKAQEEKLPIFLTGDFNEPSHHDWTAGNVAAKHCPVSVKWPTTTKVEATGFQDTFRAVYPDPVKHRGLTWTPTVEMDDPKCHHDRIDLVFASAHLKVLESKVVGESNEYADITVSPYPSDHQAVVSEILLPIK